MADEYVEMDFGTGVVKITPAHDPNDFEVGLRHNLPVVNVMNEDGSINENGGKYAGLSGLEARKQIVKDLEEGGLPHQGGAHQAQRGHLPALPHRGGAPDLHPVVCEDGAPGQTRHRRGEKTGTSPSSPTVWRKPIITGWRTSRTGASPGSCGGATASPPGTARTAARPSWRSRTPTPAPSAAASTCARMRTPWTPGSPPLCGPSPPWAGPTRPRS